MTNHGAEQFLPISPLAQWMRDTTGRPDDGSTGGLIVHGLVRRDYLHTSFSPIAEGAAFPAPPLEKPGTLTVDDVLRIAVVDKDRLWSAAMEAIASYRGKDAEDEALYAGHIWELYHQILEAS